MQPDEPANDGGYEQPLPPETDITWDDEPKF